MKVAYTVSYDKMNHESLQVWEVEDFCCDLMKEQWNDQIEPTWSTNYGKICNITIEHACTGYEVDSSGFDIKFCPFCGQKIELIREN